jgi:excinuclease ABC subunit C
VVNTEEDALLLENNLIKQWSPRYNILLKDGKTYPSICVTNEFFPRIFQTRKINRKYGTYYGPYSHVPTLYALLELIKNLFPIRRCTEHISEESIRTGRHKLCLEYHIKNCMGPCTGLQSHEEYIKFIAQAKEILSGNTAALERQLVEEMQQLASELKFEEAEKLRRKYEILQNYRSKSEVVSSTLHDIDVFNIEDNEKVCYINYLHVVHGCINQAFTFEYAKRLDETPEELLLYGITEMRSRFGSKSKEVVVPFHVEQFSEDLEITIPQRGDKRKLLELSKLNVLQYKKDRLQQSDKLNPEQKQTRVLKELKDALNLDRLPMQIECFDNSNISGSDPVAGCVVFKKAKPSKKDYRTYNIKTVEGPDDYASMQEVVRRRYSRMVEEGTPLPDLIITDGGVGQMSSVREIIEDELHLNIPIAGLAKDNKHRTHELLYGFPPATIQMKTDSALFRLLTQIQDEVHRFAISFHRNKRSKHQVASELDGIQGIGPKSKELLLRHFRSFNRIKSATLDEIASIIGQTKASKIIEYLNN